MEATYHGSCHCGAVRFACALDLAAGTSRCNCSICRRGRFWKAVTSSAKVRMLEGADMLTPYRFDGEAITHHFCRRCGVKPFGTGQVDELGAFHAINVMCLEDLSDADLAALPVAFQDGRHDRWDREPPATSHL